MTPPAPKRIVVDVFNHWRRIAPELAAWLEIVRRDCPVRTVYSDYDIAIARRQSLAHFLAEDVPAGYTHLVMLDDDLVPCGSTGNLLTADGELVYCGTVGAHGRRGHYGDGRFGVACCRISAAVAARVDVATSFDFGFNEDRTEVTRCECQVFNDQARRLGYTSRMVGVVGHCVNIVVVPTDKGVVQRWPAGK